MRWRLFRREIGFEMNGKELLFKAFRNQATPRPAWVPFVGVHGGKMIGATAAEYLQSSELIERGLCKAVELYRPDGLPIVFDLQMEAEVLGCELRWADETPPAVVSHPLAGGAMGETPTFSTEAGRYPLVFDALERVKRSIGEQVALYGLVTGPFTLALHLMGNEIFLAMIRDPKRTRAVLEYCADVVCQAAEAYVSHGADIIAVVDPMTSQISPVHFERFVTEPVNRVFDTVREKGSLSSMFVCGDATRNLECMCRTACDNVSIDENVPLEMLKELAGGLGRSFGGNMKLTTALLLGDADDAKLEALRCMEIGGTNGFVLAPGCDLPYAVPEANLEAVALMVHDEYQRHVASTTLRVKAGQHLDDIYLPDYAGASNVIVDVITLDSASCAPCQYMMDAATTAAKSFGERVEVHERKITTHEGLAYMSKLGVENLPTICIDGEARFVSIMPDIETLTGVLQESVDKKASR